MKKPPDKKRKPRANGTFRKKEVSTLAYIVARCMTFVNTKSKEGTEMNWSQIIRGAVWLVLCTSVFVTAAYILLSQFHFSLTISN